MSTIVRHPAVVLAALGAVSGLMGTFGLGIGYGEAPGLGLHMVLTGVWFGLVVAFGVWRWGNSSLTAAITSFVATWVAWEVAVNLALQISEHWLKSVGFSDTLRTSIGGFAAGGVGAGLTYIGAAIVASSLRQSLVAGTFVVSGAFLGLLLPLTNLYDNPVVLLMPWQAAVAGILGLGLSQPEARIWTDPWKMRIFEKDIGLR